MKLYEDRVVYESEDKKEKGSKMGIFKRIWNWIFGAKRSKPKARMMNLMSKQEWLEALEKEEEAKSELRKDFEEFRENQLDALADLRDILEIHSKEQLSDMPTFQKFRQDFEKLKEEVRSQETGDRRQETGEKDFEELKAKVDRINAQYAVDCLGGFGHIKNPEVCDSCDARENCELLSERIDDSEWKEITDRQIDDLVKFKDRTTMAFAKLIKISNNLLNIQASLMRGILDCEGGVEVYAKWSEFFFDMLFDAIEDHDTLIHDLLGADKSSAPDLGIQDTGDRIQEDKKSGKQSSVIGHQSPAGEQSSVTSHQSPAEKINRKESIKPTTDDRRPETEILQETGDRRPETDDRGQETEKEKPRCSYCRENDAYCKIVFKSCPERKYFYCENCIKNCIKILFDSYNKDLIKELEIFEPKAWIEDGSIFVLQGLIYPGCPEKVARQRKRTFWKPDKIDKMLKLEKYGKWLNEADKFYLRQQAERSSVSSRQTPVTRRRSPDAGKTQSEDTLQETDDRRPETEPETGDRG